MKQKGSETPLWLQSKEEIEEFLSTHWNWSGDRVTIMSGLDEDIPNDIKLDTQPVNIHKKDDKEEWLLVEEAYERARQIPGTEVGLRKALFYWKHEDQIPEQYDPYNIVFLNAIIKVNGNYRVIALKRSGYRGVLDWCDLKGEARLFSNTQFARLCTSAL